MSRPRAVSLISGARLATDPNGAPVDITIDGDRISHVRPSDTTPRSTSTQGPTDVIDGRNFWIAPGFIDLQVNGWRSTDVSSDPLAWRDIALALPTFGVTAWCPTVITGPTATRTLALDNAFGAVPDDAAEPLGWHFEGPLIAPEQLGAHPSRWVRDAATVAAERWPERVNPPKLVTLAPERAGALELVRHLVASGVTVSMGHSHATTKAALAGVDAGVSMATHVFNASRPLHHRDAGVVGVALTDRRVMPAVIADGHHLDETTLGLIAGATGDRFCAVSDLVASTPSVNSNPPRNDGGVLTGGAAPLNVGLRRLSGLPLPLFKAVAAVSRWPAETLGLRDRGRIDHGAIADLVLLDGSLDVRATVMRGRLVHDDFAFRLD